MSIEMKQEPVAWGVHDQIAMNKAIANHSTPAAPVQEECDVCGDKVRVIPRPWVGLDAADWFKWWRTATVLGHTQAEIDFADFLLIAVAVQDVLREKNGGQA